MLLQRITSLHSIKQGKSIPGWMFYCPGCKCCHAVSDDWQFNGDVNKPTFTPSILVRPGGVVVCHSFITDGKIRFLNDCSHELAGQTVELTDV